MIKSEGFTHTGLTDARWCIWFLRESISVKFNFRKKAKQNPVALDGPHMQRINDRNYLSITIVIIIKYNPIIIIIIFIK